MPGFQSSVNAGFSLGVPGEPYRDGPMVATSFVLESSGEPNIVGATAYTVTGQGTASAGGSGLFAGILVNPKSYATAGGNSGALSPTLTLPDGTQGELCTTCPGGLVVTLPAAAAIGDNVIYNTTTGALATVASGSAVPGGSALIPGAIVDLFTVAGAGIGVIRLTGQIVQTT